MFNILYAYAMYDNVVIFQKPDGAYHDCSGWHARNNSLFGHNVTIAGTGCQGHQYTLGEWQQLDPATNDVGSKVQDAYPSAKQIIDWARTLLPQ